MALASFQIIQSKLASMLANVTSMQFLCLRLGQLSEPASCRFTNGYTF